MQFGVPFTLTGPSGARAVFNNPSDADYVGFLNEVSGLDSPEVRENFDDRVESDGGVHGSFWYSRRPVVLQGFIDHTTAADRNIKADKLLAASNAMRGDASLVWTPAGGVARRLLLRRQQPVRITGAWNKSFMLPMVSSSALIESNTQNIATRNLNTGQEVLVTNAGNHPVPGIVRLDGDITDIGHIRNATTNQNIDFGGYDLANAFGNWMLIDLANRTVVESAAGGTVVSRYSQVNFATTSWWLIQPGVNAVQVPTASSFGANAALTVTWRDGWV